MRFRFALITFFLPIVLFSQIKEHKNYNNKLQYTQEFIDSIFEKKINVKQEVLKEILTNNQNLKEGWFFFYAKRASELYRKNQFDATSNYINKALNVYDSIENKKSLYEKALLNLFIVEAATLYEHKDFSNSLISYQKALDLEKKHPYKWRTFIIKGIATNHLNLGNDSLALVNILKASNDTLFMSLPQPAAATYLNLGSLYNEYLENRVLARKYFKKVLDVSNNTNYKTNMSPAYSSLGNTFLKESNIDSALYYYKKSLEADKLYGLGPYKGAEEENLFHQGFINLYKGNLNEAINNLNQLSNTINSYQTISKNDKNLMLRTLTSLAEVYDRKGSSKEHKKLVKMSNAFLETFHKKQLSEGIQNLEIKYQTKEKEASIVQLEKGKEQQGIIIKQQKIITYSLVGLLLLILFLSYLFWRQRKLKNQYEKENLEQRLLITQMNPHFIGNAMNSISALVNNNSKNAIPYIANLSNLFRLILTNSREEFVILEDELTTIRSYLKLQSNFSENFDYEIDIDQRIDEKALLIPPMLIQPFIENSIVHGFIGDVKGEIKINVILEKGKKLLNLKIVDNGLGYSQKENSNSSIKRKSISTEIIKERLQILNKKFKVDANFNTQSDDTGTCVILNLPYIEEI